MTNSELEQSVVMVDFAGFATTAKGLPFVFTTAFDISAKSVVEMEFAYMGFKSVSAVTALPKLFAFTTCEKSNALLAIPFSVMWKVANVNIYLLVALTN